MTRRVLLLAVGLVACVAFGLYVSWPSQRTPSTSANAKPPIPSGRGNVTVENIQADPSDTSQRWAVLRFDSADGQPCAAAGRYVAGRVGQIAGDGSFVAYSTDESGSCLNLDKVPAGAQISSGATAADRTVIHGLVGPNVDQVRVDAGNMERVLNIGPRGTFLAVLPSGSSPRRTVKVVVRLTNGQTKQILG